MAVSGIIKGTSKFLMVTALAAIGLGTSITDFKKSRIKTYVLWNYNRHFGNINSTGCYLVYGIDVNYIPLKLTLDFKLESKILQLFKIVLTNSKIVIQYLSKLNIFLIKSGGGTRPVEARQPVFQGAKSVGLTER